ncbi:MAG TPA: DUF2946 family protein [Solimonas sp.]
MEDWVERALARWPNVPALFGWLSLDRRGRWRIRGETISRPQIIDTFNRNYAGDEHGRWYFQNGPQRGYLELVRAPLLLHVDPAGETLHTHTGLAVTQIARADLDEDGGLWLRTEHGPAALLDDEGAWLLERLETGDGLAVDEAALSAALARPSGEASGLFLRLDNARHALGRLDDAEAPRVLGFERQPQPRPGERAVVGDAALAPD